jgi:proteasome lid subunit RPN8/RPN11
MSGELSRAALEAMYTHAREGYPEEVCGFVLEGGEVRRCENQQNKMHALDPESYPRTAAHAYFLGIKDLKFLDQSLKSERPVRVIYHSHVDVGAYFSDEDKRAAALDGELLYPVDYLVIDVGPHGARGAVLFRFQGGEFVEVARHGP